MNNQEAADELQYAIDLIKQDGKDWLDERDIPILEAAISALQEKDSLIAKLKAEAIKRNVQYMKSGDRYLIGFVDGMRLARSIVDGSIDEPKYVYPSEGMSDD